MAVKTLINFGAEVNYQENLTDESPLYIACVKGNIPIAEVLLKNGAKVNLTDDLGNTPLHKACGYDDNGIIELLLKNGANTEIETPRKFACGGRTPIFDTCIGNNKENLETLIENGCNINHLDIDGFFPLLFAFATGQNNDFELADILIEKGARLDLRDKNGLSLIDHILLMYGPNDLDIHEKKRKAIKLMLSQGIEPTCEFEGYKIIEIIREEIVEERKRKLGKSLLLCTRYFCPDSVFHEEILPMDLFKHIFFLSGLISYPVRNDCESIELSLKKRKFESENGKK